jgi:chemotaxis signal transduction protein
MIKSVTLLLFSVHNLSFGVYAEQVEELLEDKVLREQNETDTDYTIPYKGRNIRVIHFSKWIEREQKLSPTFGPRILNHVPDHRECHDTHPPSPKILIIKHQNEGYIGVRIDTPEDLVTVSVNQIHSLPIMIQKTKRIQGLWGIALVNKRPVILIDLAQF